MKYLLLIAIVLAVLWLARAGRSRGAARPPAGAPAPTPQPMVACAHCGVHLPRGEAVAGAQGLYCSEAHRLARGDQA